MDQVAIVPLGISAGSPTCDRHVSSLAVVMDGRVVLFDCGEGTQYQLMRAPFRWSRLEAIFITHLHGDHLYGLPGLLGTLTLYSHDALVAVYGPARFNKYLESIFETTQLHRSYPLEIHEIGEGTIRKAAGYSVEARLLDHSIATFGYCLIEDDLPGRFDVEKALRLNIPQGPMYGALKSGEDVRLADGSFIASADLVGPSRPGRRIAYCLDTRPCDASVELARGASLLVHEATYGNEYAAEARQRAHSTAAEAAQVAVRAKSQRLLLTHFSPRYLDSSPLVAEARAIFPATEACEELRTYDLLRPSDP
jgi:ribonuclease Z